MTFRHLKIFIRVADLGSMTAAADELFISQPTVSQAVAELEGYYGIKLFDRLSRRLYITERGRQLLGYARHITKLSEEMDQVMKSEDAGSFFRVGASLTVGSCLMPEKVKTYKSQYPMSELQVIVRNTKEIEGMITRNAIDFAIVEGTVNHHDIVATPFMEDEVVLVCGKNHSMYGKAIMTEREIKEQEFIVREPGSGTRELFENVMAANGLRWRLSWECNGSDGLKRVAVDGIGIAVISKRLVSHELQSGELVMLKIDGICFHRNFSVIHHKNKYLTESMKSFINLCLEQ